MIRICLFLLTICALNAAVLRGIVKDPSGAAVPKAAVELRDSGKVTTDEQGRFEFPKVAPGKYQLVITQAGFATDERAVEVAGDLEVVIELKIAKQEISVEVGGKLSGMANSEPVYRALRMSEPVGNYKVSNFVMQRDVATFTFETGQFSFAPPVLGKTVYAVFTGKGRFKIKPIIPLEGAYMARVVGNAEVDDEFKSAVLVFTDSTETEIKQAGQATDDGSQSKDAWREFRRRMRSRQDRARSLVEAELAGENVANIEADLLGELLNPRQAGSFQAFMHGNKCLDLRFIFNMNGALPQLPSPEEVALVNLDPGGEREGFLYMSHALKEFKDGTANAMENKRLVEAVKYEIETVIGRNDKLTSVSEIEMKARMDGVRVVKFGLLPSLRVTRVALKDKDISYVQEGRKEDGSFYVIFPEGLKKGVTYKLHVEYEGNKVVSNEGGGTYSIGARTAWYPSLNAFQDRAIYDLTFKIPKGNMMVSVGRRDKEWKEGSFACSHWVTEAPLAVAGFNFGQFKKKSLEDEATKTTIEGYATAEVPDYLKGLGFGSMAPSALIQNAMVDAQNSMRVFTAWFGPLPYGRLAITMQPEFNFGQSWPTLVYLPVTAFLDGTQRWSLFGSGAFKFGEFIQVVTPHEVAHQWWGHILGWATYRDQWLSEGFADFSAGLYLQMIEKKPDAYAKYWERQRESILRKNEFGIAPNDAGPIWMGYRLNTFKTQGAYSRLVYPKGGYVLHMLRYLMQDQKTGDADFVATMKDFVQTYRHQNVSGEAFQAIVEKHMKPQMDIENNKKMDWFFNQWVYGTQVPSYRLEYSLTDLEGGKCQLSGKFSQGGVLKGFHMPAWLYVDFDGTVVRAMELVLDGESSRELKITLPKRPKRVLLNANHDVLATSVEVKLVN